MTFSPWDNKLRQYWPNQKRSNIYFRKGKTTTTTTKSLDIESIDGFSSIVIKKKTKQNNDNEKKKKQKNSEAL